MKRAVEDFRPGEPAVPELAAGAVVVQDGTDEILLLHHRAEDRWCFPKGHVERGESLAAAALREVREETGLEAIRLVEELAEVAYRFFDPKKRHNVLKTTVYWLARTDQRSVVPESGFDEFRWLEPRRAYPLLSYDTDRFLVDRIRNRLGGKEATSPGTPGPARADG